MEKEVTLGEYVNAATLCLSLQNRLDEYAHIWQDVRRVIVRACAEHQHTGERNNEIEQLVRTINDYGNLA